MDLRRASLYITRTRVGLGLVALASPRAVLRPLYGRDATEGADVRAVTRMLGARAVALGAGSAIAVGERRGSANWVSMLALADGLDAVVHLTARRLGWRGRALALLAGSSAVGHLLLAKRLAAEVDAPIT